MSSKSSNISYRFLDWFDSLDSSRSPFLASLLRDKIDADLILGADLVSENLKSLIHKFKYEVVRFLILT